MFAPYYSVLGCFCLASRELPGSYTAQSKTVLVDLIDLGLRGWQSLGGFPVSGFVRDVDVDQVLLITLTLTHRWLPELFRL
jgi:hypothetical protein